jgi:two-component system CheB/CheR fusion protein
LWDWFLQKAQGELKIRQMTDQSTKPSLKKTVKSGSKRLRKGIPFTLVGIGASAGGLEAVTQLLSKLPPATPMAFVLVQHLDPTHKSALTTLLSRVTTMTVVEAKTGLAVEPSHLYVIPPNKKMGVSRGTLRLLPRGRAGDVHAPVDYFFRSLAKDQGAQSVGIVLSGTGTDGTLGLEEIKAAGGITFVQSGASAKYDGMPASARASGCADYVLPPERIAEELASLGDHPHVLSE